MAWYSLTVDVPEDESELSQSVLYDHGASGLEVRDSLNQTVLTVRAPAKGEAILIAYFEDKEAAQAAQEELAETVKGSRFALEDVVERDWSVEWRNQIKSVTVGRLWVGPPWEKATAPKDKVCLFIEPKMAFGTGDHPTTSLCLKAVDTFMAANPGASVLDVGTGTGVLAFAAKKLGASRCVGVDNDVTSVELAKECMQENGLEGIELSTKTLHGIEGEFDLVLANILANTLVELAPLIVPKVKKKLVLAGVLVPQADEVKAAFTSRGLTATLDETHGEWIRIEFERR
jgi:ribosomal protein L11 methyltransferase